VILRGLTRARGNVKTTGPLSPTTAKLDLQRKRLATATMREGLTSRNHSKNAILKGLPKAKVLILELSIVIARKGKLT
jgi:hypothetical protein